VGGRIVPGDCRTGEEQVIDTPFATRRVTRRAGDVLHPDREPSETLARIRQTIGEYNFANQYQQAPVPLGGGLIKTDWFRSYGLNERPERFDQIVQS
jgi:hypothetical protein